MKQSWMIGCLALILVAHVPSQEDPPQQTGQGVDRIRLVEGNTAFAVDLFDRLRGEEGNLFLAPHSISAALAMTYAGARGKTASQMEEVLHFTLPPERLHSAMGGLLASKDEGYTLHVANRLWGQKGKEFVEDFLTLTAEHYGAELRELDFARSDGEARQVINRWISDQTETMIPDLLGPGDLDPATELVLTNAIYFKGKWESPFNPEQTEVGEFWTSADEKVLVPMMSQEGKFPTASKETVHIVELPYGGERISMVIIVPKARDGLPGVEASLKESLPAYLEGLRKKTVYVRLPRFRTETRLDLAETLSAMGMPDAFRSGRADFSGMSEGGVLFLSKVITQAVVEVNEEGTEAAGATGGPMTFGIPPEVIADHPFLFLIRDRETGSILFLGRVVNPA